MRMSGIFVPDPAPANAQLPRCEECGQEVHGVRVIFVAGTFFKLCTGERGCFQRFTTMLRRGRRPLNPRIIKALRLIPSGGIHENELARAVGPYSTNTLKSLCLRGFAARSDDAWYKITNRGLDLVKGAEV